jgi:hypothetical protein
MSRMGLENVVILVIYAENRKSIWTHGRTDPVKTEIQWLPELDSEKKRYSFENEPKTIFRV